MGKTVLAAGTFDILHLGHIHYLNFAKGLGGRLVVVVSSDAQARKHGKSPMHSQKDRAEMLKHLNMVDEVVLGDEHDMLNSVSSVHPHIICLGYDQHIPKGLREYCSRNGIQLVRDECGADPQNHKTSEIKRKVLGSKEGKFARLVSISQLNVNVCPWCSERTSDEYLNELLGEMNELKTAFDKNDNFNIEEEIGDILWDAINLAHICEKERRISSDAVIERILKKIENRKPWLIEGRSVTKDEAARIWNDAKKREKAQH